MTEFFGGYGSMEMQECTVKFLDVFLFLFSPQIQECLPEVTSPSADPTARSSFACPWKLFFVSIFCSGISSSFDVFHPET